MNFISRILTKTGRMLMKNPSTASSVLVFGLGFAFIANNAIYGQSSDHPSPIYGSVKEENVKQAIKSVRVTKVSLPDGSPTLIRPESLRNIPVPTVNPIRTKSAAAHSSLVREVQSALAGVGLYEGKVDGIYGTATRESIISYQQRVGILPDGEASYGLLTNIKSAQEISKLQQRNLQDSQQIAESQFRVKQPKLLVFDTNTVARIQTGLREKFAEENISVDGLIGQQTRSAIKRFQKRFKLKSTGELNEETIQKLVSLRIINNI